MRLVPSVMFEITWNALDGPELEKEYRFDPTRRWRADYAHPASGVMIEIDGGLWRKGGHSTATGILSDREKDLAATLQGWHMFRLPTDMITDVNLRKIIEFCKEHSSAG